MSAAINNETSRRVLVRKSSARIAQVQKNAYMEYRQSINTDMSDFYAVSKIKTKQDDL